jgi:hypothetical protein
MVLTLVEHPAAKDVVLAVVGASAGLAGLVLVFLGVLVSAYQSLLGKISEKTLQRIRTATEIALGVFAFCLAVVALGIVWLVIPGGHCFYVAVVVSFFVELGTLVALAWYATVRVLIRV